MVRFLNLDFIFQFAKRTMEELCETSEMLGTQVAEAASEVAKESVQNVARLLGLAFEEMKKVDPEAISEDIVSSLEEMKETGVPAAEEVMKEIGGHLEGAVQYLSDLDAQELFDDIGKAAAANLEAFLAFWDDLQDIMDKSIENGRELVRTALPILAVAASAAGEVLESAADNMEELCETSQAFGADVAEAASEVAKESVQNIARLLGLAFEEMQKVDPEAISEDIVSALEEMKETGVPAAEEVMKEIGGHLEGAVQYLSDLDAQELFDDIGKAAAANLEAFLAFWDDLQDIMDKAIENGRELVRTALPILAVGASAAAKVLEVAAEEVKDGFQGGVKVVGDIYNSREVQDIIGESFEEIEDAFSQSRESLENAMKALAGISVGGCAASCPLLQLEIFRDFAQMISLFFTNLYHDVATSPWLQSAKAFFGGIANFIAIDLAAALQSEEAVMIGLIVLLSAISIAYICYIWFACKSMHMHDASKEIRDGHEAKSWAEVAAEQQRTVKFTTYVITGCLSVYLPIARLSAELLSSKEDAFLVMKLTSLDETGQALQIGQYISIFLLLTFILPLPFMLYRVIQSNKPTGCPENPDITYDIDGEEVPFDDKTYNRLVKQDPNQAKCPYRSLYQGFERKWAYYKVVQLGFKLALALSLIVLAGQAQAWVSLAIYGSLAGVSFYTSPFIDPMNDGMDSSGRIAALITCFGGALLVSLPSSGSVEQAIGFTITIANAINGVVVVSTFCLKSKAFKSRIKNIRGKFSFSDTVLEIETGTAERLVPGWDLEREVKHRIWHTFWEGMLLNKCGEDVARRLLELKDATMNSGIENIRNHWRGQEDSSIAKMRLDCRQHLEGVDVYWNDASGTRDGVLDSKTCFGKMYIVPYPFHCVVVYDDAKDESFIRDDKFETFYKLNMTPQVIEKRTLRQKIRCLARWGGEIEFPFSREETETVADGTKTETYEDAEGNSQTRQVTNYSTVTFTCYYNRGRIQLATESKSAMAAGFNVSMRYADGTGQAVLPNTGETHHFHNRCATMGPDHIGLHDDMSETATLSEIFQKTDDIWTSELPKLIAEHDNYRQTLIQKARDANKVLGDGFWYFVYNNHQLPREALLSYLDTQEGNDTIREMASTQAAALDFLFRRMAYVNSHPAIKLWYVFWDDFYYQNKEMDRVVKCADDFNPIKATSICYRVLKRQDLEQWLDTRKLIGSRPTLLNALLFKSVLFNESNLDTLYQRITELQNPDLVAVKV